MIIIKQLVKQYSKKDYIKYNNLILPSTGVVLLSGENGTGKTTLLDIISLNDFSYKGDVLFDGLNLKKISSKKIQAFKRQNISYVRQKNNLLDFLSKEESENLSDIFANKRVSHTKSDFRNLSEGEQMKLVLSSYLKPGKSLYILDEVFTCLSEKNQKYYLNIIKELKKNALIIIVSHGVDINEIVDFKIHLSKSNIIEESNPSSTFDKEKKFIIEPNLNFSIKKLFSLYFLKRVKILSLFFIISVLFLSFLNVGTPFLTLQPSIACTSEIKSLKSFYLHKKQINSDIIFNDFKDSVYYVVNNADLKAQDLDNNFSSYNLYGNIYYEDSLKDEYCHISPKFYNYLMQKCGYKENHKVTVYYYANQNYTKEVQIKVDPEIENNGYYVKNDFFNFAHLANNSLIYLANAYRNTKEYNAEYYNNKYKTGYYLITKSYAKEQLEIKINESLDDNVIYINEPSLFTNEVLQFSNPPLYGENLYIQTNYNELLKNVSLKLLDYPKSEYGKYFIISDDFFKRLKQVISTNDLFAIFLNKNNKDRFFKKANDNNVLFYFNYERNEYSFSINSTEYNKIQDRLNSRAKIIENKFLISNSQRVIVLCYILSISYLLFSITFINHVSIIERNNLNILRKDGFSTTKRLLVIFSPYLLVTIISMTLSKFISLSLGNMADSLTFNYYFIPLNILIYVVLFCLQLFLTFLLVKRTKFRN